MTCLWFRRSPLPQARRLILRVPCDETTSLRSSSARTMAGKRSCRSTQTVSYANLAKGQLKKIAAEEARITASDKARQAEQEKARLAAEGARQAEQAKAVAAAKVAEQARLA